MIKVVCGIIYKENEILVCRRNSDKTLGGYWEFPGGKVEHNENSERALKRELREELSMSVRELSYFTTVIHEYDKFTIELIAYKCEFLKADFIMTDHDKYEWLELNQILNKKMAPADIPIVHRLEQS